MPKAEQIILHFASSSLSAQYAELKRSSLTETPSSQPNGVSMAASLRQRRTIRCWVHYTTYIKIKKVQHCILSVRQPLQPTSFHMLCQIKTPDDFSKLIRLESPAFVFFIIFTCSLTYFFNCPP